MKNKKEKRLYFAFGSNLRQHQIHKRCPHYKLVSIARVDGMKLAFTGYSVRWRGAPATILSSPKDVVWGAIFELDNHCVKRLDKFEGLTTHSYHHKTVSCITNRGDVFDAYTYIRKKRNNKERLPSKKYLSHIINGAKECDLPSSYIKKLENTEHR